MINKIREDLISKKGKVLKFRHNGSRNQIEEFKGIITETYNYVFTIKTIGEKEGRKEMIQELCDKQQYDFCVVKRVIYTIKEEK